MKKSGGGGGGGGDLHDIKSRLWAGVGVHVPNVIYSPDIYIHV